MTEFLFLEHVQPDGQLLDKVKVDAEHAELSLFRTLMV